MSFEPECRPFDYPEAPWNQCCPPGFQRKPSQLQTVLPSASPATASSSSSACCCRPPARAPLVAYGGALFPWFPAGVAIAVPPETATPSTEEERPDKAYIEAFMERCTSPNGPPPTDDVIKMIRSWCGTEAGRKAVCGVLREQLQCGGDPALRAIHFVQAVPTVALGSLVDALNVFIKDESHPYAYARCAAEYRDSAPPGGGGPDKGKYRWEQFQTFVGNPRCDWRPAPEEIGKPLPNVEEPKAPDGWQWAMFNRTIMDIHAYCQNGYEWPSK